MSHQTKRRLADVVHTYLNEGSELMTVLFRTLEGHKKSGAATVRAGNWLGRFQIEVGQAMRNKRSKS